jgi:DNA-binding transcriptional LysR family regulator
MTTFKQLDAFVALADARTFESAARRLQTVQSAVSRHVLEFEESFERQLLDRSGRRAALTVDGAEVLILCRSILRQRDAMVRALSQEEPSVQMMRIGVTEVTALTWLHRLLEAMRAELPSVAVEPHVEKSTHLRELLLSGQLDMAVVPDTEKMHGVMKAPMGSVDNRWYCSPKIHPGAKALTTKDLGAYAFLTQGNVARSGIMLDEWLRHHSIAPRSIVSSNSLWALIDLAAAGMGIAYLPTALVSEMVQRKRLREISVRPRLQEVNYVMLVLEERVTSLHRKIISLARASCDFKTSHMGTVPSQANLLKAEEDHG